MCFYRLKVCKHKGAPPPAYAARLSFMFTDNHRERRVLTGVRLLRPIEREFTTSSRYLVVGKHQRKLFAFSVGTHLNITPFYAPQISFNSVSLKTRVN